MASPFRIPKKTVLSDSAPFHRESPLSRLQRPAPQSQGFQCYGPRSGPGARIPRSGPGARIPSEGPGGSSVGMSKLHVRDYLKKLLGLDGSDGAAANHTAAAGSTSQPRDSGAAGASGMSNGGRPRRASDRLQQPDEASQPATPPPKKRCGETAGIIDDIENVVLEGSVSKSSYVTRLRGAKSAGTSGSSKNAQTRRKTDAASSPGRRQQQQLSSGDDFKSPPRKTGARRGASSTAKETGEGRRSATRAGANGLWDVREQQRERWTAFKEKKNKPNSPKVKPASSETIVLSSEDEEPKTSNHASADAAGQEFPTAASLSKPAPSFLNLDFVKLHAGLIDANANGQIKITESGITIPLKGTDESEEAEVTVVASQLRGHGLWDGGMAKGGTLLADWHGPAPSLLFLWVTDAQANLLQRELFDVCWSAATSPPCPFLLLVLKEQLPELEAALLASILDMKPYHEGRACLSSPLAWADGLLLLHTSPSPQDHHFLRLLGHAKSTRLSCSLKRRQATQDPPTRLIQYPKAPCKGRITVTQEDLLCLNSGELLNDVIIDFYLKYLLLEGVGGEVSQRTHVFSSFFFKQLSRRRAAMEDNGPSVPDRYVRHRRVKTWTRNVDIFSKDFLIIPVNQDGHWFLAVVCYPGLLESCYEDFNYLDRSPGKNSREQPPHCTLHGWTRDTVLKRPCILILDSLLMSYHGDVCKLIRDYLQVEWEVRRNTPRTFNEDTMKSCNCKVPQQDNGIDCGLYLLQYAHSFLENPVVHFDLPLELDGWFPRQQVRQKREEIRSLILKLKDEAS